MMVASMRTLRTIAPLPLPSSGDSDAQRPAANQQGNEETEAGEEAPRPAVLLRRPAGEIDRPPRQETLASTRRVLPRRRDVENHDLLPDLVRQRRREAFD